MHPGWGMNWFPCERDATVNTYLEFQHVSTKGIAGADSTCHSVSSIFIRYSLVDTSILRLYSSWIITKESNDTSTVNEPKSADTNLQSVFIPIFMDIHGSKTARVSWKSSACRASQMRSMRYWSHCCHGLPLGDVSPVDEVWSSKNIKKNEEVKHCDYKYLSNKQGLNMVKPNNKRCSSD